LEKSTSTSVNDTTIGTFLVHRERRTISRASNIATICEISGNGTSTDDDARIVVEPSTAGLASDGLASFSGYTHRVFLRLEGS
jgi:hypothetical protein